MPAVEGLTWSHWLCCEAALRFQVFYRWACYVDFFNGVSKSIQVLLDCKVKETVMVLIWIILK